MEKLEIKGSEFFYKYNKDSTVSLFNVNKKHLGTFNNCNLLYKAALKKAK